MKRVRALVFSHLAFRLFYEHNDVGYPSLPMSWRWQLADSCGEVVLQYTSSWKHLSENTWIEFWRIPVLTKEFFPSAWFFLGNLYSKLPFGLLCHAVKQTMALKMDASKIRSSIRMWKSLTAGSLSSIYVVVTDRIENCLIYMKMATTAWLEWFVVSEDFFFFSSLYCTTKCPLINRNL